MQKPYEWEFASLALAKTPVLHAIFALAVAIEGLGVQALVANSKSQPAHLDLVSRLATFFAALSVRFAAGRTLLKDVLGHWIARLLHGRFFGTGNL